MRWSCAHALFSLLYLCPHECRRTLAVFSGEGEERCPDTTINPVLHRFSGFISSLVVNPSSQVQEQDALMNHTINADRKSDQVQAAMQRLPDAFPLKAGV